MSGITWEHVGALGADLTDGRHGPGYDGAGEQMVTISKAELDALRESAELFHLLLEHSPAYLVIRDQFQQVLRLSRNFENLLGRPLDELVGRRLSQIFPAELVEQAAIEDQRLLADGLPRYGEEELNRRYYASLKFHIPRPERPGLMVDIKTDITQRKELENAIHRLNAKLDRRVAQRTAQLKEAVREQESFSYTVSHDLRAPLRHINSFATVLLEDFAETLPEEGCHYLDRILTSTRAMGVLIDNLLELSRVSRAQVKRVPVNLSDLARSVAEILQETDSERHAEFHITPGIVATCDPILARQLMENLIGNAWKYTGKCPCARIEFGRQPGPEPAAFYVKDNGVGFNMAYQHCIFDPFQRLHGDEFEGNGIGLATAQRIVQRHGGSIWAQAAEGEGACFFFTFP